MPASVYIRGGRYLIIKKIYANFEEYICIALLAIMSVVVFWQVVCRFILKAALPWSEELSIYIMAWVTFLGASVGVKRGAHIGVEAMITFLPRKIQKYFTLLSYVASAIFFLMLIYFGSLIVQKQIATGQVSPAMRIPIYYAYLSIPVGSALMSLRFFEKIINELKVRNRENANELHVGGN
ncbi:TRAP transporter small permease subunit [Thermanaerosceptrum fracticalcis]|uniref:TRAP transporter small permease subunit n=1 Tax=Thermanaerosceptrum fracticalcis TaxID=1712410 RepID=A0A7G6E6Z3_THEFR|nr:TRAP transporter small permease [Thermanaerosceptrum fracticalcis]QNB47847.1 TRAP transporter small permease subunit [Thermanaerosceptrum fracticalcis]